MTQQNRYSSAREAFEEKSGRIDEPLRAENTGAVYSETAKDSLGVNRSDSLIIIQRTAALLRAENRVVGIDHLRLMRVCMENTG